MGVQLVSERKTRQAATMTGLPLIRCFRHSNRYWYGFVRRGSGHWHIGLDPVTWEWTLDTTPFSSCDDYGPHVDPPEGLRLMAVKAALTEGEESRADRMLAALRFYATPTTYELQGNPREIAAFNLGSYVPIIDDKGALARAAIAAEEED